ncbi:hypothetical protein BD413DRAFT_248023 [Trametes elegans]|nr:hypothetical protein BD413DRAFT_248023 [Trametes elegans]
MSSETAKSTSSSSSSPQIPEGPPPQPIPHYPQPPPYGAHYPPPPGPYPPFYAYPVPDPSHHDPNAPNGAPSQPVAPFFMAVPPPPPGMVYAYPMPPTAPGYPFAAGMPPPQAAPKPKRKQVKMAVSKLPFVTRLPRWARAIISRPGLLPWHHLVPNTGPSWARWPVYARFLAGVTMGIAHCTNCASACKRCDEARPCERCVKYGLAETCVDGVRKERKKGIKRGPYKRKNRNGSGEPVIEGEPAVPPPPPGYPMPPEGYPFPLVYPPYSYVPPPADGQQHPEGSPSGAPPPGMPHPVYPPYPAIYPHPYGAYPGAPPMGYPPLVPAPVAASPSSASKPDSSNGTPANGAPPAETTGKGKKRARGKGDEGTRASKKNKEAPAEETQPNGSVSGETTAKDQPPPPPPPTFAGHPDAGPAAAAFNGPEPRPLMATM